MNGTPLSVLHQLVWNRLLAIVEDQAQTLIRTAFSTVVREAGDLSAGVFNAEGLMLAQAVTGTPGHVNAMAASVKKFLAIVPLESLHPGDVLITNDPWIGTGHLNDFTVVTPAFYQGRCVALFAATSHIADVGGRGFGPDATSLYEEGIQIPVMHLFQKNRVNATLLEIVRANVRDPDVAVGDLYSLAACNDRGNRALIELLDDFNLLDLEDSGAAIIASSAAGMAAAIDALPSGQFDHEIVIDGYDKPLLLRCRMQIGGGSIALDFSGSAAASTHGINVPLPYTQAYASFGVRCIVGNDIPNNAGSLAAIRVHAIDGSLLAARRPSSVSARHAVGQMLPDLVLGCLAQAIPEQVPAEGASCIWNPVFMHDTAVSTTSEPIAEFVINPIFNGGTGARPGKDGLSTTAFPSGVRTTPTEINEATSPLVIWRKEYRQDSAGVGEFRGGLGQIIEIGHQAGAAFWVSKMFDRIKHPAAGRQGGGSGAAGAVRLDDGAVLRGKGKELVPVGRRLILETPGGGGIGRAGDRDPGRVSSDLAAGLIGESTARHYYNEANRSKDDQS